MARRQRRGFWFLQESDCGHEFLVEVPGEAAARISEFAAALRT